MYSLASMGKNKLMENWSIDWEWMSKIWVSVCLSYSPGLSLNLPPWRPCTAVCCSSYFHHCSLLLYRQAWGCWDFPYPHTWSFWWGCSTGEPLEERIHREPKHSYNPQHPTGHEQSFLPKVLPSKLSVRKQQQRWEIPDFCWWQLPVSPRGLASPHPSPLTHLLTGIWHKGAVDAEAWKHLLLFFQRVRLGKAVQKQFCSKRKRRKTFPVFPSMPPCSNHSSAVNTQCFFSNI